MRNTEKSSRTNLLRSKGILVPNKPSKKKKNIGKLFWNSGKDGTYVKANELKTE